MDDAVLARLHGRIDSLLSELSGLSQRVARMEVQESRVTDNARDIDKLQERCEAFTTRLSKVDVALVELKNASPAPVKSKTRDYAEKGGLVAMTGVVIELLRWLMEATKN